MAREPAGIDHIEVQPLGDVHIEPRLIDQRMAGKAGARDCKGLASRQGELRRRRLAVLILPADHAAHRHQHVFEREGCL